MAPGGIPELGLALVRLAQGDVAAAAVSIRHALEHPVRVPSKERPPNTDLQRALLLEAQVEIRDRGGDIDRARSAADELYLIAARFESKALVASAAHARGRVRLADGDERGGAEPFPEAAPLWNEVGAPMKAATARLGLADAHRAKRQPSACRLGAPSGPHHPRRDPSRAGCHRSPTSRTARPCPTGSWEASTPSVVKGDDLDGDLRRALSVRATLKGTHYLARLLADPGREFHVLDLVAGETGSVAHVDSGQTARVP